LADYQFNVANGFYVAEAQSGINGVAVDTIGNVMALNGVASTVAGLTIPQSFQSFSASLRTTGTFSAGKFTVEGTVNGSDWLELAILNATSNAAVAAGGFAFTTAAVTLFTNAIDTPLRYIRPRLSGTTAGGTGVFVAMVLGGL
jgi:hypothetical protein